MGLCVFLFSLISRTVKRDSHKRLQPRRVKSIRQERYKTLHFIDILSFKFKKRIKTICKRCFLFYFQLKPELIDATNTQDAKFMWEKIAQTKKAT